MAESTSSSNNSLNNWNIVRKNSAEEAIDDSGTSSDFVNINPAFYEAVPVNENGVDDESDDSIEIISEVKLQSQVESDDVITPEYDDDLGAARCLNFVENTDSSVDYLADNTINEVLEENDAQSGGADNHLEANVIEDEDDEYDDVTVLRCATPGRMPFPLTLGVSRQSSESDSESDFIRLDNSFGHEFDRNHVMNLSNMSSISQQFRFVNHPSSVRDDDDLDSLPPDVDFDDRCESDISGSGPVEDLSNYGLGDEPIVAGRRVYKYRPNIDLDRWLTALALGVLLLGLGLGAGHYYGSQKEAILRRQQVDNMRDIQEDYMSCLRDKDSMQGTLAEPYKEIKKLETVSETWKEQYEELILERASLEHRLKTANDQTASIEAKLKESQAREADLEERLEVFKDSPELFRKLMGQWENITKLYTSKYHEASHLKTALWNLNRRNKVEIADLKADLEWKRVELINAENTIRNLNRDMDMLYQPLRDNVKVKEQLRLLTIEHDKLKHKLKQSTAVLALPDHSAIVLHAETKLDQKDVDKVVEDLRRKEDRQMLNKMKQENEDLKIVIGKMRYSETESKKPENDTDKAYADELYSRVKSLRHDLDLERGKSYLWQQLFVSERSLREAAENRSQNASATTKLPPTFATCMTYFVSSVENASTNFADSVLNLTKNGDFVESAKQQTRNFADKTKDEIRRFSENTKQTVGDIHEALKESWNNVKKMDAPDLVHVKRIIGGIAEHTKNTVQDAGKNLKSKISTFLASYGPDLEKIKVFNVTCLFGGCEADKQREGKGKKVKKRDKRIKDDTSEEEKDEDRDQIWFASLDEWKYRNKRNWQKHQKKVRQIRDRIHGMNEQSLYGLDDDDIEDIYEDLDDIEDDSDLKTIPEQLSTWLSCQIRWWRSRFHRKHRSVDLGPDCGQQLLKWQLRAVCPGKCKKRHCNKSIPSWIVDFCKSQDNGAKSRKRRCHKNKSHTKRRSHDNFHQYKHFEPLQRNRHFGTSTDHRQDKNRNNEDLTPIYLSDEADDKHHQCGMGVEVLRNATSAADWLFKRADSRQDLRDDVKEELKDKKTDSFWYFRAKFGADEDEDYIKSAWHFQRATGRKWKRNEPWYSKRAEGRRAAADKEFSYEL